MASEVLAIVFYMLGMSRVLRIAYYFSDCAVYCGCKFDSKNNFSTPVTVETVWVMTLNCLA